MSTATALAPLVIQLRASCGTHSWDCQSRLHAATAAARRMREAGDGRLTAILDRAESARPHIHTGPVAALSRDMAVWRSVARRVERFIARNS